MRYIDNMPFTPSAPTFDVPETNYSLQLRPLVTGAEDRAASRRHYALCLWLDQETTRYEIASLSGFVVSVDATTMEGDVEMFRLAKALLTADQAYWNAQNKDDRRQIQLQHQRWLNDEASVELFSQGMDKLISVAPSAVS